MKEDFRTEDREVHETESVQKERLNDSVPDKAIIRGLQTENRIYKKKFRWVCMDKYGKNGKKRKNVYSIKYFRIY